MATCYRHPDRETGLACSVCDRPICVDCVTYAPVGLRCPDHSGKAQGVEKVTRGVKRAASEGTGALVTRALIAMNVVVFLLDVASGSNAGRGGGGEVFQRGALFGPLIEQGEWWRIGTSMFLHGGFIHLFLNMFVLWLVGRGLEERMGRGRYLALYAISGLAGSAGALVLDPCVAAVGASGAIFGLFGAALVLERQGVFVFAGSILPIVILNVVFTFSIRGISIGGHLGGLIGGALVMLAISRLGRSHALYGRIGVVGAAGLTTVAVGVVALALYAADYAVANGCSPLIG